MESPPPQKKKKKHKKYRKFKEIIIEKICAPISLLIAFFLLNFSFINNVFRA